MMNIKPMLVGLLIGLAAGATMATLATRPKPIPENHNQLSSSIAGCTCAFTASTDRMTIEPHRDYFGRHLCVGSCPLRPEFYVNNMTSQLRGSPGQKP